MCKVYRWLTMRRFWRYRLEFPPRDFLLLFTKKRWAIFAERTPKTPPRDNVVRHNTKFGVSDSRRRRLSGPLRRCGRAAEHKRAAHRWVSVSRKGNIRCRLGVASVGRPRAALILPAGLSCRTPAVRSLGLILHPLRSQICNAPPAATSTQFG